MRTEKGTVEVNIGSKKFSRDYDKRIFETFDDVLTEAQKGSKSQQDLIDHINYSVDLGLRVPVRAAIVANEGAVAQAFEKQVRDLMKVRAAAAKPVTEDQARKLIEMLAQMDVPV